MKDLFAIVDDFSGRLQSAVAERGTLLQGFESVIEDALGINDNNTLAPLEQTLRLFSKRVFSVHTNWSAVFTQVAKFDLNLDVLESISGLTDFLGFEDIDQLTDSVNLEAASQVNVLAEIDAVIDVGIVLQLFKTRLQRRKSSSTTTMKVPEKARALS